MKNFRNSDYAINKYSNSIVYRFTDRIEVVTLSDYLSENPEKTEEDFKKLKILSDEMYLEQVRTENAQTKKNVSLSELEETEECATNSLEEEYLNVQDRTYALKAVEQLFKNNILTETQNDGLFFIILKG